MRASSDITQRSTLPAVRDIENMLPYHEVSLMGNEGKLVYDAIIDSDRIMFLTTEIPRQPAAIFPLLLIT